MQYPFLGAINELGKREVKVKFVYLASILFSFAGMLFLDYKYQLAFFYNRRQTLLTLVCGLAVFLLWDILGIGLGIFFEGQSDRKTHV